MLNNEDSTAPYHYGHNGCSVDKISLTPDTYVNWKLLKKAGRLF